MKFRTKRAITLLEIMIVIVLIGLIGSVIGFNMKGSLDKGKAFKTEHAMQQIRDILSLELAKGATNKDEIAQNPEAALKRSGLVNNPDSLIKDGWGNKMSIELVSGEIRVHSAALNAYQKNS